MGVLLQHLLRAADAHFFQQLQGASADLLPTPAVVGGEALGDLVSDTVEGIEAGHGILQHDTHPAAPQTAQLLPALLQQGLALKRCRAGHGKALVQQAHGRLHGHGLPAA